MAGPGIPRGEVIDEPVYNHDLAPTILDAVGAEPGREQDGVSLLPAMRGDDLPERALLLEALAPALPYEIGNEVFDRQLPFHGVRTPNWKYIDWSSGDEELYDLREDPYELENLAADSGYADEKQRMSALADDLRGCAGSGCLGLGAEAGGGGEALTAAEHRVPGRATGFVIGGALLVAAGAWAVSLARRRRPA
jgi:arylsulfatase A-like enzyme